MNMIAQVMVFHCDLVFACSYFRLLCNRYDISIVDQDVLSFPGQFFRGLFQQLPCFQIPE